MSRVCQICHKNYNQANIVNKLRGKYNRAGKKKQRANLQSKVINGKKMIVCVNCMRTLMKKSSKK